MKVSLLAIFLLVGCVTQGRQFPSEMSWIEKSRTTQNDVRRLMGDPMAVGNSSGTATWTFGYYRYKVFGKSAFKELKFYWNPDKTVKSYTFNSSFPTDTKNK